ncbi:MAG: hypothetical protein GY815_09215 [Gammaproteobacteria bacterium]|nr:hypothetical protein [Gammaproteobacteria bacterium]
MRQALENGQRSEAMMIDVDEAALLDELRLSGDYPALKATALSKTTLDSPSPSTREPVPAQLLS